MSAAIETVGLTKRYGRRVALSDCTLSVPTGKVVGLVGPNGAGKTTLLHLAVGLLEPSAGRITVLGGTPAAGAEQLGRVGFVAQNTPVYASMSVADHLRFGGWVNPTWDQALAEQRIEQLGLDPRQKAGTLSGGQRAQLALTLAIAKRPELLILDEPVASLDPLARREFLQALMAIVVEHDVSVVLSSHLVADLERVCDYLVVLVASRVQVAGEIDELLASHHRLCAPSARRRAATVGLGGHRGERHRSPAHPHRPPRRAHPRPDLDGRATEPRRPRPRLHGPGVGGRRAVPGARRSAPMIRLAWRQFRAEGSIGLGVLVVVAVVLAATGPHLMDVYRSTPHQVLTTDPRLQNALAALVLIVPALVGVFFGAPLVARELEAGTYRLAWTQSVTRVRWLAVKLAWSAWRAACSSGGSA